MKKNQTAKKQVEEANTSESDHDILSLGGSESTDVDDEFDDVDEQSHHVVPRAAETFEPLQIKVSTSLRKKLKEQAEEEGIDLQEYITELLAESVVLRAWEIIERKSHMRGQPPAPQNQQNQNQNQNQRRGGGNNRQGKGNNRRGMSHSRYQAIMDDKATFLEYVRNQEKKRSR